MAQAMPYLFDSAKATGSHLVSQIVGMPIPASGIFEVFGLRIQALPVPHGPDCVSQAFMIGPVLYMSDVSEVPSTIFEHVAALPNPLKVNHLRKRRTRTEEFILLSFCRFSLSIASLFVTNAKRI